MGDVKDVKLPCIVDVIQHPKQNEPGCIVSIPDLYIDVKGANFVEAMARAVELTTGIYYYYEEHNIPFPGKYTWEEIEKECRKTDKFPTWVVVL